MAKKITRRKRKLEAERRLRRTARSGTSKKTQFVVCRIVPVTRRIPLVSGEALRLDEDRSLDRRLAYALERGWIAKDDIERIRWEICPHNWMRFLRRRIALEAFDLLRFKGYRCQLWDEFGWTTALGREVWQLLRRRIRPFGYGRQEAPRASRPAHSKAA